MVPRRLTRRDLLSVGATTFAIVAGCTSAGTDPETPSTRTQTPTPHGETPQSDRDPTSSRTNASPTSPTVSSPQTPDQTTNTPSHPISLASVAVKNHVIYPLSSTHPTVHRRAGTQYLILSVEPSMSEQIAPERLDIRVDSEMLSLAERQPVQWQTDTIDVAFAISKNQDVTTGDVLFEEAVVHTFSDQVINRLNNPPRFEVTDPVVSPEQIQAGATETARLEASVANTGEGPGTFAASLSGSASGSKELTVTVDPGDQSRVTGRVMVAGQGEEAKLRLDWGSDQLVAGIPVIGTSSQ